MWTHNYEWMSTCLPLTGLAQMAVAVGEELQLLVSQRASYPGLA